jgi:putative nucleotidyltransferase with HDIG domain
MNSTVAPNIRERVDRIETTPAIPMVLQPLLKILGTPAEFVDIEEVTRLVSYDNAIAAQCLRAAGSPLFGLAQPPKSVGAAVVTLGLRRVQSILLTCCVGQAFAVKKMAINPVVFWRHSLGCAMVCRTFSEKLVKADGEKAYAAGLLHDLGFLVNSIAFAEEFAAALATASREQIPLYEAELSTMGFTHCETGRALAEKWGLAEEIIEVIAHHHAIEQCEKSQSLVAIVHLSDLMCRMRNLDYGYYERHKVDLVHDSAWEMLAREHKELNGADLELFTFELDDSMAAICDLVSTMFG